ncbi:MAG: ABC transporter ATP-binding protein [Candidatus Bathyarchaeota archaeon]|nr:ABC transporter ATP-binding protein [Candidatus Bathyarchaeota archaeon]
MNSDVLGRFENVVKRFNNAEALCGLSFDLHRGVNGLIGPNGAGKTTTLKLSLGLIKATSGSAQLLGFDCWRESLKIRRKVGVLYEKVAFYDHLSGLEYLKLMAKFKDVSDVLGDSKRVLKLVALDTEAQHRRIGGYSAGMRQRIGLAQALLGTPELVILDEPTSNLDPIGRTQVLNLINSLKKDCSFIISSHILPELEKICEHVILMHNGQAVRQGSLTRMLSEVDSSVFLVKVEPATAVAELLRSEECVKDVTAVEGSLVVVAKNPVVFKQRLPAVVAQANASLEEVKAAGNDLEALFKTTVSGD